MPFDPANPRGVVPPSMLQPLYADMVGDADGVDPDSNAQEYLNLRRFLKGVVSSIAARDALIPTLDALDVVAVASNSSGDFQFFLWDGAAFKDHVGGGGTGSVTLPVKDAVYVATTAALATNTATSTTLTANANGALATIDGASAGVGKRVLVKNEATTSKNGIYEVTDAGSGATPWILTRAADANTDALMIPSMLVPIEQGTTQADQVWMLTSNGPFTLGTTAIVFARFGADAVTLGGVAEAVLATASTIAKRGTDGTIKASNHASLGAAGASGTLVAVDGTGKIPAAAIPAGSSITSAATVTAAKALTGLTAGALVLVQDLGIFRFVATQPDMADDETIINVTAGGQLVMEAAHPDAIMAYATSADDGLQEQIDTLVALQREVCQVYNTGTIEANGTDPTTFDAFHGPDTLGDYDLNTDTLIARAGWYSFWVALTPTATGNVILNLYLNGTLVQSQESGVSTTRTQPLVFKLWLDDGDTVNFTHNAGSGNTIAAGLHKSSMIIERVS